MTPNDGNGMPEGHRHNPEVECTPVEVSERLKDETPFVLIDCRTDQEREIARIEPSIHAPMHELHQQLDDLRDHEDTEMVVYCHHGVRSLQVTMLLRSEGFSNVRSMSGGIDLWSRVVDDAVPLY